MGSKHYTPEERAQAVLLAEQEGSAERAGRKLNIPGATIRRWMNGERAPGTRDLVQHVKGEMLERLTEGAMLFFDRMLTDLEAGNLSAGQAITAFGVTADKVIALRRDRPRDSNPGQVEAIAAALALDVRESEDDGVGGAN